MKDYTQALMEIDFVINSDYADLSVFAEMQNYKLNENDIPRKEREPRPVTRIPLTRGERIEGKRKARQHYLAIKQEKLNRVFA